MARQLTYNPAVSSQGSQVTDPWAEYIDVSQPVYTGKGLDPWAEHIDRNEQVFDSSSFLEEYDRLREQALARGEFGIPGEAGVELLDVHRQRQGLPELTPGLESVYETQADMTSRANRESRFRDIVTAPGGKIAGFGSDIVGALSPQAGREMRTRAEAYYGAPQSKAADIYGTTISTGAQIAALAPGGPLAFAAAYGVSGAGGVRTDIAELRADGEEISGKEEAAAALLTGGVEGVSGLIGGALFGRIAKKLSASIGGKVSSSAIKAAWERGGTRAVVRLVVKPMVSVAPEVAAESVEEAVTQWLNNEIARATYAPKRGRLEGVGESAIYGAAFAPFGGAVSRRTRGRGEQGPPKETRKQKIVRLEQELTAEQKVSRTDELTKLGNRRQEKEDIKRIYSEADEAGESVAVVETDIGNFKAVNDTLGHDVGDSVIRAAAESFQEAIRTEARRGSERGEVRPADTVHSVNRVGGDEFPIKLRGVEKPAEVATVMVRAQEIFAKKIGAIIGDRLPTEALPFIAWGAEIRAPGDSRTPEQLTKEAEGRISEVKARIKKDRGTPETREELARLLAERQAPLDAETERAVETIDAFVAKQEAENANREEAALEPEPESDSEEILRKREKLLPPDKRYDTTKPQRKRVRDLLSRAGKAMKSGYVEWLSTRGGRTDAWFRAKDRVRTTKNLTQHDLSLLLEKGRVAYKEAGWDTRNPADQRTVTLAINGDIPVGDLPVPLQDFVNQARLAIDEVSTQAANLFDSVGLKKQAKTYRGNIGKYLKAMFHNKSQGGLPKKALRLANSFYKFKRDKHAIVSDTGQLVKKYDTQEEALLHIEQAEEKLGLRYVEPLTAEYRSEYQIDDPLFLVARSIAEIRHNTEVVRLFHLAATTEAVEPPPDLEGPELAAWAEENGLVKLPGRGIWHELHRKYVPKVVAEDLMEVTNVPNAVLRSIRAYERAFKEANTVLNPATHGTNAIGNTMVFSWLDGNSPFNPVKFVRYYAPAWKHLRDKSSQVYRLALKHGVIRSDFVSVELNGLGDPGKGYDSMLQSRMRRGLTAPLRVARRTYELEDTWFKMASFLRNMDHGASPEQAAKAVDRSYPNYNHLSKITKYIKKVPLLSPFVSFADQGPKKVLYHAKTIGGATRIAAPFLMLQFLDELGKWWLTDEQRILIEEAKSDSILERQFQVVLPGLRNNRGAPVLWDLRNYIPMIRDVPVERGSTLIVPPFTGPLVQTVQEQLSGVDQFTGHQFIREDQTRVEGLVARGKQIFKSVAPIPSIVKHGPAQIERATDTGPQDTALAILRALTGVRVDTPYIKERHVRSIVEQMILTDSFDEAESLVDTWNEQFRPLNREALVFSNLMSAVDRRLTDRYNRALQVAANRWLDGDFAGALREAKTYNKGKSDYAYEITEEDIKWKAEDNRAEGKTRGKY